ncbi:hypothetical protein FNJ84_02315 [Paracoccus sp. M683]|uniref:hypothetical protein n=1 Tax=Paracoccus sp. M683 TaxID=2594268 RepID=UPI00117C8CFA|nr:hypothetical protein [Paracoccus sp. M683]TRW99529.1 hypothetical protein FNJ84_02315 [Paracoccus sp. M683]
MAEHRLQNGAANPHQSKQSSDHVKRRSEKAVKQTVTTRRDRFFVDPAMADSLRCAMRLIMLRAVDPGRAFRPALPDRPGSQDD